MVILELYKTSQSAVLGQTNLKSEMSATATAFNFNNMLLITVTQKGKHFQH